VVPFSLFLAMKYLRPKRSFISVVTIISILGVLLGVAILVIVLSVFTGFGEMWREKILSFKPHLTIYRRYGIIEETETVCRELESVEGVTGAAPVVLTRTLVRFGGRTVAPVVVGVDPDRVERISQVPRFTPEGVFDISGENMVIGYDLAARLGVNVGDKVLVYSPRNVTASDEMYLPEELTVAGIFNMGMRDFDSEFALTSIVMARELVGVERGAHAVYAMTVDPFRFAEFVEGARARLARDYVVHSWRDEDRVLFGALRTEKTMMFVLLVFITIVAIFCVTNTLIVITVQKTNEIGLLKALGFRSWKIMGAFVWHGWIQCLLGTLAGIGTGLLVLTNLTAVVDGIGKLVGQDLFPKEIYGLDEIPWSTSPKEIAVIAAFVMVFCTLASFLPAFRAARLDPVQALRHE